MPDCYLLAREMNIHKDHPASCLCCKYLDFEQASGPYSDVTPDGDSAKISCKRNMFDTIIDPDTDDMHQLTVIGISCSKFEARD